MTLVSPAIPVRPGCHRPPMTGTAALPHLEPLTPAAQRRRLRAGGSGEPVFTSQPNGRPPFRPYVYRAAGPPQPLTADQLEASLWRLFTGPAAPPGPRLLVPLLMAWAERYALGRLAAAGEAARLDEAS